MYIFMFILGSVIGSFICVYVNRSINKESIIKPRSHCDMCGKSLKPYDMIPIVSFIVLEGKCRYCHKKIDRWAFFSELILGLLFVISYHIYGLSANNSGGANCRLHFVFCKSLAFKQLKSNEYIFGL